MKAVILAGGRGTRGRPFTDYIPKAMIPVQGRPLVYYITKYLAKFDIVDEVIILGNFQALESRSRNILRTTLDLKNQSSSSKILRAVQEETSST